jgi:DNA polymerase III subunit epsilon
MCPDMTLQRSFEELGVPLSEVTFCIIDLETTGGSPADSAITEIGGCKVKRGEVTGTFHTLVNPGQPVPAFVRLLTGITDDLVCDAPSIEAVLPSLLEFVRDTVIVAHNARFDVSFLNAALDRAAYPLLDNRVVDTALLARKVLGGEVHNHKLSTLADHLRCAHKPRHRAFADVLATIDLLHCLIERVAGYGVTTLEDLLATTSARLDGTFSKIRLAEGVPSCLGIYRFRGTSGETLYVGKAADLRSRVRSYFYGDPRGRIRDLLRRAQSVEVERHSTMLEAEVAEARAIATELPPFNRAGKKGKSWYLRITSGPRARASPARRPKEDGSLYLGPFSSLRSVRTLLDALRDAAPIHRCSDPARCSGCAFYEIGRCAGAERERHRSLLADLAVALIDRHQEVVVPLFERMRRLALEERFEEAAEVRDRGALLERALRSASETRTLVAAGEIVLRIGTRLVLIRSGQLAAATDYPDGGDMATALARLRDAATFDEVGSFVPARVVPEVRTIAAWLRRGPEEAQMVSVQCEWSMPVGARPLSLFSVKGSRSPGRASV